MRVRRQISGLVGHPNLILHTFPGMKYADNRLIESGRYEYVIDY
jgi:hypothetical protein